MEALTKFVLDPHYHEVLAIVKGVRNGVVYGAKVRFPHALVMTFLFRSASLKEHIKFIYKATKQHATNLGSFVFIYKTLMLLQKKANGDKQANIHPFLAGLIGGYIVFGENNNINNQVIRMEGRNYSFCSRVRRGRHSSIARVLLTFFSLFNIIIAQIVLYLFSRIMVGLAKMPVKHKLVEAPQSTFSMFAAVIWGIVMWQFANEREVLQPSLQASMQYLYLDSNKWDSLRNFIWHNK
ncbi:Tim17/Tim22/Tim23/Pmp24 family-domain-containing protein [Endogone sp. FLAS-F59071]|nr:Tim17/Tim22/Tim23/Pmp24 family-domain-containing protein [Endogone sp. FLAS-F59071]|eukprot:RUS16028.1 Tim17/Tim22/Tim23/Pmp24 family-domain-containing protein [Endogone sp. FLAS-F59071]